MTRDLISCQFYMKIRILVEFEKSFGIEQRLIKESFEDKQEFIIDSLNFELFKDEHYRKIFANIISSEDLLKDNEGNFVLDLSSLNICPEINSSNKITYKKRYRTSFLDLNDILKDYINVKIQTDCEYKDLALELPERIKTSEIKNKEEKLNQIKKDNKKELMYKLVYYGFVVFTGFMLGGVPFLIRGIGIIPHCVIIFLSIVLMYSAFIQIKKSKYNIFENLNKYELENFNFLNLFTFTLVVMFFQMIVYLIRMFVFTLS